MRAYWHKGGKHSEDETAFCLFSCPYSPPKNKTCISVFVILIQSRQSLTPCDTQMPLPCRYCKVHKKKSYFRRNIYIYNTFFLKKYSWCWCCCCCTMIWSLNIFPQVVFSKRLDWLFQPFIFLHIFAQTAAAVVSLDGGWWTNTSKFQRPLWELVNTKS